MIKGVWQLSSLSVRYCAHGGSSRGARCVLLPPRCACELSRSLCFSPSPRTQLCAAASRSARSSLFLTAQRVHSQLTCAARGEACARSVRNGAGWREASDCRGKLRVGAAKGGRREEQDGGGNRGGGGHVPKHEWAEDDKVPDDESSRNAGGHPGRLATEHRLSGVHGTNIIDVALSILYLTTARRCAAQRLPPPPLRDRAPAAAEVRIPSSAPRPRTP